LGHPWTESLAILTILMISSLPGLAKAQVLNGQNWEGPDNNYPLNWNYSPQTAVNESNVAGLQVSWTWPVPDSPSVLASAEGVMVTPLVVQGVVYGVTNWGAVFALNADDGAGVWLTDLPLQENYSNYLQPSVPPSLGYPIGHFHQILYTTKILGSPLIWVIANTYQVFALNAYTGSVVLDFNPLILGLASVSGNRGIYDQDTPTILIDQLRGIMLFGPSDSEGESSGRGYVQGWNVNTSRPQLLWTSYIIPPQDGGDPSWSMSSVENMSDAYIFNGTSALNLKSLPQAQLRSMLYGDWGTFGYDGYRSYAGASTSWGGPWAIDDQLGLAYIGTNTPTPDWNGTDRPGPDLWSDSVLALNVTTGRLVWGFQAMPHSLGDLDCAWNVLLANQTIEGRVEPVVYKGCKDGYIFALDGTDGSMMWYFKPPTVRYDNVKVFSPTNETEMTKVNWYGYPSKEPIIQNPSDTGSLESDISYDPTTNSIYLVTYNEPKLFNITNVGPTQGSFSYSNWEFDWGVSLASILNDGPTNSTVTSLNASNGSIRWSYFVNNEPYRGGLTVSGGVVYASLLNGTLMMLDAESGAWLASKNIGGELLIQPAIGEDASGSTMIFLTDTGSSRWGPAFAGFIQALAPVEPKVQTAPLLEYYMGGAIVLLTVAVALLAVLKVKARNRF